jgi:hypothetical protein
MPTAQVNFTSGNWVKNLTLKEQEECYNEIKNYFQEEVIQTVSEMYDNFVDDYTYPV